MLGNPLSLRERVVDSSGTRMERVRGCLIVSRTPHPARTSQLLGARHPLPHPSRMFPTWTNHEMAKPGSTRVWLGEGKRVCGAASVQVLTCLRDSDAAVGHQDLAGDEARGFVVDRLGSVFRDHCSRRLPEVETEIEADENR